MARVEVPRFLASRVRLFLSADIVGSTAFKQQTRSDQAALPSPALEGSWLHVTARFYDALPSTFTKLWQQSLATTREHSNGTEPNAPVFWKALGDEIIYQVEIQHSAQACTAVLAWMEAARSTARMLKQQSKTLDIKCTAWIAGFPIQNSEVPILRRAVIETTDGSYFQNSRRRLEQIYALENYEEQLDFIGPSIDIGFRLSKYASSDKFVVSCDLAHILLTGSDPCRTDPITKLPVDVHFDGRDQMKGVLGGEPYPVFWLDMNPDREHDDELLSQEYELLARSPNQKKIKRFIETLWDEHHPRLFKPFFASGIDPNYNDPPQWYADIHDQYCKTMLQENTVDADLENLGMEQAGTEGAQPDLDRLANMLPNLRRLNDE